MAFLAGATGQNLGESQFGIASVKFRWNLSGSYQQAIPRYILRDKNGGDEKEFLNEFFPDIRTLTKAIFLKGYQWPFDPRKAVNHGSSLIDVLVDNEINRKDREVFLDFTRNPSGMNGESFSFEILDPVVYDYLKNCNALKNSPIDRLLAINAPAYDLYRDHGIDLQNELLKIAVCAQHNNGGLKGDIWWESDLRHLFPVGEVNGSHGVYRPGGSALNSGQVGSGRAALYISRKYNGSPMTSGDFIVETGENLNKVILQAEWWMNSGNPSDTGKYFSEIRKRMSSVAGIYRSRYETDEAALLANEMLAALPGRIAARDVRGLVDCFLLMDHCLTHFIYLRSIHYYISHGGRSRGSYMICGTERATSGITGLCTFDRKIENEIIEATYRNGILELRTVAPRDIPEQDLWFEKVWKDYLEDICPEG
jgi:succinate dehydrogenase/fumarate reductase flavoprotein subunit